MEENKQPRNIFEQIAMGLQVTNENTVAIAADLANLYKMVEEIHQAMFPQEGTSEPNASGAEESLVVRGTNI